MRGDDKIKLNDISYAGYVKMPLFVYCRMTKSNYNNFCKELSDFTKIHYGIAISHHMSVNDIKDVYRWKNGYILIDVSYVNWYDELDKTIQLICKYAHESENIIGYSIMQTIYVHDRTKYSFVAIRVHNNQYDPVSLLCPEFYAWYGEDKSSKRELEIDLKIGYKTFRRAKCYFTNKKIKQYFNTKKEI